MWQIQFDKCNVKNSLWQIQCDKCNVTNVNADEKWTQDIGPCPQPWHSTIQTKMVQAKFKLHVKSKILFLVAEQLYKHQDAADTVGMGTAI